jgi:hypothetical protein
MGNAAKTKQSRECRVCKTTIFTDAEGIKKHALVCAFEARTGLVIVQKDDRLVILE